MPIIGLDRHAKLVRLTQKCCFVTYIMLLKQACFAGCAQTLHDETASIGKIHPFSQIAVTLKTSLLRRLQAQTLPDEAPPVGKSYLFNNIAETFEPMQRF